MPERVRREVEGWLGTPVVTAVTQPTGFSPGVAVRPTAENGRRAFLKAVSPEPNPEAPLVHRREISIVNALPTATPVPRLLWSHDEGDDGWVVLAFEDIDGRHPTQPWQTDELDRVVAAMEELAATLTPSPVPAAAVGTAGNRFATDRRGWRLLRDERPSRLDRLDEWSRRNLDALIGMESTIEDAIEGDTLLHQDLRSDNILLAGDRTWFVDWPHARIGAAWLEVVTFAPSVTMQGGPPPENVVTRHAAIRVADPDAVTAAAVALAGFFTHRAAQPPPPGLPTVRAFQDAQGAITRDWVSQRTGLS